MKYITVKPSDLPYLDRCPRCYARQISGMQKPRNIFPKVTQIADAQMKAGVMEICQAFGVPAQSVSTLEKVVSEPIVYEAATLVIVGKVDRLVQLEDGSFGVVENKLAEPDGSKFKGQVNAYAWALASATNVSPRQVTRGDLFFATPIDGGCRVKKDGDRVLQSFVSELAHIQTAIDPVWFKREYLDRIAAMASCLELPPPGEFCDYCASVNATVMYDADLARLAARKAS